MNEHSNISIRGEEHRRIRLMVTAGEGPGALIWIDDVDGCAPLANLRLTAGDAQALAKLLAAVTDPGVIA